MQDKPRRYLRMRSVDRMLRKRGIGEAKVFYSPVWLGLGFTVVVLLQFGWIVYLLWGAIGSPLPWIAIPYCVLVYLANARFNSSFALTEKELVIVNPFFPFRRMKTVLREDILNAEIGHTKWRWPDFFFVFSEQYLSIQTVAGTARYHCSLLEEDTPDVSSFEYNIDDLVLYLTKKQKIQSDDQERDVVA